MASRALRPLLQLLWRSWQRFSAEDGTTFAAALSFNFFFSLFPFLLVLAMVGGTLLRDPALQRDLVDLVVAQLPAKAQLQPVVASAVDGFARAPTGLYGLVTAVALLWSASAMFHTLSGALDRVFGLESGRTFVHGRAMALVAVPAAAGLVFVSLVATTVVQVVGARLLLPEALGNIMRWGLALLVPLALSMLAFGLMYRFIPAQPPPTLQWALATSVGAVGFEVTKLGFGIYVANARRLDLVYGTLAGVVACLFFLYLVCCVILFAAALACSALPSPGAPPPRVAAPLDRADT
ncbi:MAG: YihY/virulence factor BrkB family protein [Myxococcaceae bacterium]|nr:YihY/virulence factor BrkB family protein [Myxococcaceae bacterium]